MLTSCLPTVLCAVLSLIYPTAAGPVSTFMWILYRIEVNMQTAFSSVSHVCCLSQRLQTQERRQSPVSVRRTARCRKWPNKEGDAAPGDAAPGACFGALPRDFIYWRASVKKQTATRITQTASGCLWWNMAETLVQILQRCTNSPSSRWVQPSSVFFKQPSIRPFLLLATGTAVSL